MSFFGLFGGDKLKTISFGLALGLTWALGVLFLGLAAVFWQWGVPIVEILSSIYIGFDVSFGGAVIGAAWGFLDGFIGGVVFVWLYNKFSGSVKE